jgi:hypothetical protein
MAEKVIGYCMKCKAKKEIKGATKVKTKNNKDAIRGECVDCATKMYKMGVK